MSAVVRVVQSVTQYFLQHEDASVEMFDHMVKSNNLLYEFAKYGFDKKDLDFIKEQIAGPQECAGKKVGMLHC